MIVKVFWKVNTGDFIELYWLRYNYFMNMNIKYWQINIKKIPNRKLA